MVLANQVAEAVSPEHVGIIPYPVFCIIMSWAPVTGSFGWKRTSNRKTRLITVRRSKILPAEGIWPAAEPVSRSHRRKRSAGFQ
ncbi:hypothetical protein C7212DRAFT_322505, partial [Tuber magnatum]